MEAASLGESWPAAAPAAPSRTQSPACLISPAVGQAQEDRGIFIYKWSVQMFSLWFAVHWCHLVGGELN